MTFGVYWSPNWWAEGNGAGQVYWPDNYWANASDGVPPTSSGGAGAFELSLDQATVRYSWMTGVHKAQTGQERRANIIDDPAVRYEGSALLLGPQASRGDQTRAVRTRLARFAALGSPFLLGLTYEALALRTDSTGTSIAVFAGALAMTDWAVPGVRVIVRHAVYGSAQAVIQSVTADTIEVAQDDGSDLGNVGKYGASIMPAASIFLDAQQSFDRYQPAEPIERWQIKARNADGGFRSAPEFAELALEGIFEGLTIRARVPGTSGNAIAISYFGGASSPEGTLVDNPTLVEWQYQTSVSTIADLIAALNSSLYVRVTGSVADPSVVIGPGTIIDTEPLVGGVDAAYVEVGIGATLTEYRSRPVWDRPPIIDGTLSDSIQSMNEPRDMGGLPFTAQTATVPDWGRSISMRAPTGAEWQWAKKALWTLGGSWRTFWFSSWRKDLVPVGVGTGTLTVQDGEASGDVQTWYPAHRRDLGVRMSSTSVVYARIASATNNGDGTTTLALVDEDGDPVTLGALPSVVSWLELVRMESDECTVTFVGRTFSFEVQARVVQEVVDADGEVGFLEDEASVEASQPREGIELTLPAEVFRLCTGTRDTPINGNTFTATPSARSEIRVITEDGREEVELRLPIAHPFVSKYMAGGFPPRLVLVTIYRLQLNSDEVASIWRGHITSVTLSGVEAVFKVPSRPMTMLGRRLPTLLVGRACPHILYDQNCQVDRASFRVDTTVASVAGRKITVTSIGGNPDQWALNGEVLHVSSGERMTISDQTGAVLTMQLPINGLQVGDSVQVFAGCDHAVETCRDKFDNVPRFGGHPSLPKKNPFFRNGLGLYTSEN